MNNLDDLSLMSGISNISRIPKLNSSLYHKIDFSTNFDSSLLDISKSYRTNGLKSDSKSSDSKKILRGLGTCEDSTYNYFKLKFIYDCLEEVAHDQNNYLEKKISLKLKNWLTIHEVKKYLNLPKDPNFSDELTLLGIVDLPKIEFNYEERLSIKSCLENKLREKMCSFITLFSKMGGSTKDVVKNNEGLLKSRFQQLDELEFLHWKEKIEEVCLDHIKNLQQTILALNKWNEVKSLIKRKILNDCENLLLRAEIAEMKAEITCLSASLRLFKETPVTAEAYKILSAKLDEKINNINDVIDEKNELKKAYKALDSTEYDGILKKYLELCNLIEKKKKILELL